MTRTDVANYLGLAIETVSRTMTRLTEDRLIGIPNLSDNVINDRPGLEEQAGVARPGVG